jgi:hypothetical protein
MPDFNLHVQPVQQETTYFCGPAAAEMVLRFLGVAPPPGPKTWQEQIRDYIEKNTNAKRPSLKKAPASPDNPSFKEQKCDLCDGDYECWATTPNVLKSLLNANQSVTTYKVSKLTTERTATDTMLDNVDAGRPAVALVEGWQHFVVIDGYRHDQSGSVATSGRNLNGVWFCDPLDGVVHYMDFSTWEGSYLYFVPCGTYLDTIVVIRATS